MRKAIEVDFRQEQSNESPCKRKRFAIRKPQMNGDQIRNHVFIVLCATAYEGDNIEGVFFDEDGANQLANALQAKNLPQQEFRVEKWQDGARECEE